MTRLIGAAFIAATLFPHSVTAASVSYSFSGSYQVNPSSAFADSPLNGPDPFSQFGSDATETRFFEFGTPPTFLLPKFQPSDGTLTEARITYTLGTPSGDAATFGNKVRVTDLDTNCGVNVPCDKELDVLTTFTYGLDVVGVTDTISSVGGQAFDVATTVSGSGSFATDGTAPGSGSVSAFNPGQSTTRSFFGSILDDFVGNDDIAINTVAAARTRLDLTCTATAALPGGAKPLEECEELVQVNFAPVFDMTLTYFFDAPIGSPGGGFVDPGGNTGGGGTPGDVTNPGGGGTPPVVPVPAGLPLLLSGAFALALLRKRR